MRWALTGLAPRAVADAIVEVEAVVQARDETLDRVGVKRQVSALVGWSRYTAALDKLLESVIPRTI